MFLSGIFRPMKGCRWSRTMATVIRSHNNRNSNAPLLEKYRPVWPDSDFGKGKIEELPIRTIDDNDLNFGLTASFEHGAALFYPHLPHNPADFKVKLLVSVRGYNICKIFRICLHIVLLQVAIDKLGLNKEEQEILIRMVASRYNVGKREIMLTSDKFPNRIENKRYLSVMLEKLVSAAKMLHTNKANLS